MPVIKNDLELSYNRDMEAKKNIVVIGGGTGTAVVLSSLKDQADINLTAIVVVSDNGGSTGRLRDEFGFLPVGDIRQCIAALASGKNEAEIRRLLLYRFKQESSLAGHNLGNLILTALEDLASSPAKAVEIASKIFRISGRVLPVSEMSHDLKIDYEDGQTLIGESNLDNPELGGRKIKKISLTKTGKIYSKAKEAIVGADTIILGPGDLYGSLLANTLLGGFTEALAENKKAGGRFLYISNLMTHFSQTNRMTLSQHISEIEKYCQRPLDIIISNSEPVPSKTLEHYAAMKEWPVIDDLDTKLKQKQIEAQLLAEENAIQDKNDSSQRSLLRHDKDKLRQILRQVIFS